MGYSAYVFGRPGGAEILGSPYGHVGFGFQVDDAGTVLVGGCEVPTGKTSCYDNAMGFWTKRTTQPLVLMATSDPYGIVSRYDACKIIGVEKPNVAAAEAKAQSLAAINYKLLSQNCRTDTVEILQAFGVTGLPGGARPSAFFATITATAIPLTTPWPNRPIDVSLYSEFDQYGSREDPSANDAGYVADATADAPIEPDGPPSVISSVLLRKGFLALFPENQYCGAPVMASVGLVLNVRDLPWGDPQVKSWYASSTQFDATILAGRAGEVASGYTRS